MSDLQPMDVCARKATVTEGRQEAPTWH